MSFTLFISWSQEPSRKIAEAIAVWLRICFSSTRIFLSTHIAAGKKWSSELEDNLESIDCGILIYTNNNLNSLWMAFEAGALSKNHTKSRIVPLLFDVNKSALHSSISQFQSKDFNEEDFRRLLTDLNNLQSEDSRRETAEIEQIFAFTWPQLKTKIQEALTSSQSEREIVIRSERELLEELLERVRELDIPKADEIAKVFEQIKATSQGNYIYIDGERAAFEALIAATYRARRIIRSTRFSPRGIATNQPRYGEAIRDRVLGEKGYKPLEEYHRIIATNEVEKIKDIEEYFKLFHGRNFNLYLTPIEQDYELVILDENEVFIHFFEPDSNIIGSTLYLPGTQIAQKFIAIFDERLRDPRRRIEAFTCMYMKESDIESNLEKVRDAFDSDRVNEL
ncbi:MAG: TIR domain-containing protein [Stenomitos rutilans HA7619-LM2]|jgi:hypothetical protein|nr:TIR domain-containing protein [Stenomitos rutilans HA7619-LM2]